ncbi:hypothetical protein KAR91_84210 [Candidatus Pacearchaeota archaeon]|nr:hypothetical protein [Candidatus Pacearchaeota archaeon]
MKSLALILLLTLFSCADPFSAEGPIIDPSDFKILSDIKAGGTDTRGFTVFGTITVLNEGEQIPDSVLVHLTIDWLTGRRGSEVYTQDKLVLEIIPEEGWSTNTQGVRTFKVSSFFPANEVSSVHWTALVTFHKSRGSF